MIASLILPAVIAGVAVFFGSFLIWVVSKWHHEDFKPLPDEKGFLDATKAHDLPRGFYLWPMDTPEAMKTEAFKERWQRGHGARSTFVAHPTSGAISSSHCLSTSQWPSVRPW